jgi:hypothetical protein
MRNISADACAKVLISTWIARYGVPDTVTSDQGKQFDGNLFRKVTQTFGINKVRTTAYWPQSNGILERQHRTIKDALRCLTEVFDDWEEALPMVLLSMRTAVHANGFAPSTLVFGESLQLPIDLVVRPKTNVVSDQRELIRTLRNVALRIREVLISDQPRTTQMDAEESHPIDEYVWVEQPPIKPSLSPKYKSPFRVVSRRGAVIVTEQDRGEVAVNVSRTKPAWGVKEMVPAGDDPSESEDEAVLPATYRTRSGRAVVRPLRYRV